MLRLESHSSNVVAKLGHSSTSLRHGLGSKRSSSYRRPFGIGGIGAPQQLPVYKNIRSWAGARRGGQDPPTETPCIGISGHLTRTCGARRGQCQVDINDMMQAAIHAAGAGQDIDWMVHALRTSLECAVTTLGKAAATVVNEHVVHFATYHDGIACCVQRPGRMRRILKQKSER